MCGGQWGGGGFRWSGFILWKRERRKTLWLGCGANIYPGVSAESKQRADLQRSVYCSRPEKRGNASVQAGVWIQHWWPYDVALTFGRKRVKKHREPITTDSA